MYNAQCDSINPMSVEAIVKDFNKTDKLKGQPNPVHVEQVSHAIKIFFYPSVYDLCRYNNLA